jgi:hypothetical protein
MLQLEQLTMLCPALPCPALPCPALPCPALLQLWDREGKHIRTMASLPLAEDIPIAFNSCRTGAVHLHTIPSCAQESSDRQHVAAAA